MMFNNRAEAAEKLAEKLGHYRGKHPLVLAIPRGAVPMAKIIAEKLGGSYDVVLVRKLRAPFNRELAIGSVDESGWVYLADYTKSVGASDEYIARLRKRFRWIQSESGASNIHLSGRPLVQLAAS